MLGRDRILYHHDPRHVDVLVRSLGLQNGNTVQTPIIRKCRSLVVRYLFFSRDRADITFAVNELSDPSQHSFSKLKATRSALEGRETVHPSSRIRGHESRSDSFLGLGLDCRQKRGSRQARRSRSWTTPFESVYKKTANHRQKQCRSRPVCSSIGSVRSEGSPEHDV